MVGVSGLALKMRRMSRLVVCSARSLARHNALNGILVVVWRAGHMISVSKFSACCSLRGHIVYDYEPIGQKSDFYVS